MVASHAKLVVYPAGKGEDADRLSIAKMTDSWSGAPQALFLLPMLVALHPLLHTPLQHCMTMDGGGGGRKQQ